MRRRFKSEECLTISTQDMTKEILPLVLPAIMNGLVDADDDVRAVSSAALLPVADQLADTVPQEVRVISLDFI